MSIPQKGWILVAIPLLGQLVFLTVLTFSREHQEYTMQKRIHTKTVLAQAETCQRCVVEAQMHMRGYVLTQDPTFIEAYLAASKQVPREYESLQTLVQDNAGQLGKVKEMTGLAEAFVGWMDENIQLVQKGQRQAVIRRLQSDPQDNPLMQLNARLEAFLTRERELDTHRQANHQLSLRLQTFVLLVGAVLAVFSSMALLLAFSRSISSRVTVLIDNANRLAEGKDLAPPLQGQDELRQIDDVFHQMATTIRQKEQENELFVYSVSHDLRSPLVNLQGFSQELAMVVGELRQLVQTPGVPDHVRTRVARLIDRDAAEAIRFIQSAVTRLAGIIDALLRLSRIGRVEFRQEDVDVQTVVTRIVAAMHGSTTQRQATVQVADLPPCWGDSRAVDQIFANLLNNAINYLDPRRRGIVEVGCLGDAATTGFHTYFVKDNGVGIPQAFHAKIFVAFQRLHPEAAPGEGIGLAVVRRVVDRLGGKVWVESTVGEGTTFFVALPVSPRARASGLLQRSTPPSQPPTEAMGSSAEWHAITPETKTQA